MRNPFFPKASTRGAKASAERIPRHSSGWTQLLAHLRANENLRILDIGPTSSSNINFITGLGHGIYMANLVEEAASPEWKLPLETGQPQAYDVDRFVAANLDFGGRTFDVITLWDTADYLPAPMLEPVLQRLRQVIRPAGQMLAYFHSRPSGGSTATTTAFCRYHLTATDNIEMQRAGNFPLLQTYTNRQIEALLEPFGAYRFFLAKDNIREVMVKS